MELKEAPVWPTIRVTDMARARAFYEGVLGLNVLGEMSGHVMYGCGEGTGLIIYEGPKSPANHTLCGWEVDDLDATMRDLRAKGVVFEDYDMPNLKTVDGVARYGEDSRAAWFKDPDGYILSVNENQK